MFVCGCIASFFRWLIGEDRGVTRTRALRARTRYSAPTDAEPPRWASHLTNIGLSPEMRL
jgi:hypothetical protein